MSSKFITIEGIEGSGKTTVIATIAKYLHQQNLKVITTREPGGTEIGEKIRDILLDDKNQTMHPETEVLLMFAARAQHWHTKIQPNLQQNNWVISDRFVDSSFAYQGGGRGLAQSKIAELEKWLLADHKPDLTLFLDVEPEVGIKRIKSRGEPDRFEQERIEFFNKVRQIFMARAQDLSYFKVIDANQSIDNVCADVISTVQGLEK